MLAFSYLSSTVDDKSIALPIVLLSPGMVWQTGSVLHILTMVALCLIPFLRIQRKNINVKRWTAAFGKEWPLVLSTAQKNANENPLEKRHSYKNLLSTVQSDIKKMKLLLSGLDSKVQVLTSEVQKVKWQLDQIQVLTSSMSVPSTPSPQSGQKRRRTEGLLEEESGSEAGSEA